MSKRIVWRIIRNHENAILVNFSLIILFDLKRNVFIDQWALVLLLLHFIDEIYTSRRLASIVSTFFWT